MGVKIVQLEFASLQGFKLSDTTNQLREKASGGAESQGLLSIDVPFIEVGRFETAP